MERCLACEAVVSRGKSSTDALPRAALYHTRIEIETCVPLTRGLGFLRDVYSALLAEGRGKLISLRPTASQAR
jgi:hypothetical protein